MTPDPSSPPRFGDRSSGARSLWVLLSLVAHAGVALLAAHRPMIIATAYALTPRTIELAAPDLAVESPRAPLSAPLAQPVARSSESLRPAVAVSHPSRVVAASAAPEAAAAPTAPARPSVSAPASPPRFVLAVGRASPAATGSGTAANPTSAAPANQSTAEPSAAGTTTPFTEATVDTPARLLRGDAPAYTREAEAAGVEAEVALEIVIDRNGAVTSARALRPAGYGLDAAALHAIAEYRFTPARRNGLPVAVRMHWRMRFQLR